MFTFLVKCPAESLENEFNLNKSNRKAFFILVRCKLVEKQPDSIRFNPRLRIESELRFTQIENLIWVHQIYASDSALPDTQRQIMESACYNYGTLWYMLTRRMREAKFNLIYLQILQSLIFFINKMLITFC